MRKRFTRTARPVPPPAMRLALYSALGGCALAWASAASALGLGEISLHSALNQPFNADIPLSDVAGLDESDLNVSLASPEAFAQAGVERSFFLTDLRFTPLFRNGRNVIHVSSSKVVVEPYLSFIVQVTQPTGQVLRTYTVLIDPPGAVALAPPLVATNARPELVSSVAPMPAPVAPPASPPAAAARAASKRGASAAAPAPGSDALTVTASQNQQLQQSVETLQEHVQTLEEDSEEKDRRLAELQSRLAEAQALAAARVAAAPVRPANPSATAAPADPPVAGSPVAGSPVAGSPVADTPTGSVPSARPQTGSAPSSAITATASAAAPTAASTPVNRPTAASPLVAAPQTSDLTWLLQLGALGALLLLIAAWVLQRRRQRPASPVPDLLPVTVAASAPPLAQEPALPLTSNPAAAARREQGPATDALDAASIYIAYGRFNEALGVLREGLQRQPNRLDLRLRILEVLGLQGDAHGYAEEEAALRANGEQDAVLDQTRARFPRLAPAAVALAAAGAGVVGALAANRAASTEPDQPPRTTMDLEPQVTPVAPTLSSLPQADETSDLDIDFNDLGDLDSPLALAAPRHDREQAPEAFQLNLDDLSLDADWSSMDPFERPPAPAGRASPAPSAGVDALDATSDALFFSNLRELPEVMELPEEEFLSDFADEPLTAPGAGGDDLDAAFLDNFAEAPSSLSDFDTAELSSPSINDVTDTVYELPQEAMPDLEELSIDFDSIESQALAADRLDQARSLLAQGQSQEADWLLHELLQDGDEATREAARQMLAGL